MRKPNHNDYWSLNSWGTDQPPVNADAIIQAANLMIDQYYADNPDADDFEFDEFKFSLWERFCSYDRIGDTVAEYLDSEPDGTSDEAIRDTFKKLLSIPERIRAARQAKGYTQRQLGELMGYEGRSGETVVQNWEYGKRPVPLEKIRALAATLGLTLDDLIP